MIGEGIEVELNCICKRICSYFDEFICKFEEEGLKNSNYFTKSNRVFVPM